MKSVQGKAVLITGAGSGIGRAAAVRLHVSGARLMLVDVNPEGLRDTAEAIGGEGPDLQMAECDVRDAERVQAVVDQCVAWFGQLDGAVNAAGIIGHRSPLVECPSSAFADVLNINVLGMFNCLKAELPVMERQGRGSIVNLSSTAGLHGTPLVSAYATSKHAVIGLTRSAALEYGSKGVRINALCPGLTRTSMTGQIPSDRVDAVLAAHPIGRMAEPEEMADVITWLLSGHSSYVTGAIIAADGGLTAG